MDFHVALYCVNNLEDRTSLQIEDNDVDEMPDKNLCFGPAGNKVRVKSDMDVHRVMPDLEMEPVRRSVSLDCGSASVIYLAEEINFPMKGEASYSTIENGGTSNMEPEMKQSSEIIPAA